MYWASTAHIRVLQIAPGPSVTQHMHLSARMDEVVFVKILFEIHCIPGTKLERTVGGERLLILQIQENYTTFWFDYFKCILGVI